MNLWIVVREPGQRPRVLDGPYEVAGLARAKASRWSTRRPEATAYVFRGSASRPRRSGRVATYERGRRVG